MGQDDVGHFVGVPRDAGRTVRNQGASRSVPTASQGDIEVLRLVLIGKRFGNPFCGEQVDRSVQVSVNGYDIPLRRRHRFYASEGLTGIN